MSDYRDNLRIKPLAIRSEFHYGEKTSSGYVTNLSEGGAFLATEELIPVGEEIRIRIFLPGQIDQIETDARIMWRTSDEGSRAQHMPSGMGLAFIEPDPQLQEKLQHYIKRFFKLAQMCEGSGVNNE